jgi:hypothetical protein
MKFLMLGVLAFSLLVLSACVFEPYGNGGRGDHLQSDDFNHAQGQSDYGRHE